MKRIAALLVLMSLFGVADGQEIDGGGLIDVRLTHNSAQKSQEDGGFGSLRYGGTGQRDSTQARLAAASLYGTAQVTSDILAFVDLRAAPGQRTAVDLIEATLRYRPVSLSP